MFIVRGGILEDTIWSPWLWPRSLQVLEDAMSSARRQLWFWLFWRKWAKVMTNFVSSGRTPESLRKNFEDIFFLENVRNFREIYKILKRRPFFCFALENAWNFRKIYEFLEGKPFFFWRSLPRCVQWRIQKILVRGDDKNFKHKTSKIRMCCNQARSQKFAMQRQF